MVERSIGPGAEEPAAVDEELGAAGLGAAVEVALGGWWDWARRRALLSSFMQILINSLKSLGMEI